MICKRCLVSEVAMKISSLLPAPFSCCNWSVIAITRRTERSRASGDRPRRLRYRLECLVFARHVRLHLNTLTRPWYTVINSVISL